MREDSHFLGIILGLFLFFSGFTAYFFLWCSRSLHSRGILYANMHCSPDMRTRSRYYR